MTQIIKVKTGSKLEDIASYSRVVAVDNWIFVSNTAGRHPHTGEMPSNVFEQTEQVFRNIERALQSVDATLADVVASKVFIQNPQHVSAVMAFIGDKFRGINPATTVTCPPLGATIYEVELEVTAYRGASRAEVEEKVLTL
ncbi:RidA family protein [Vibrio furnissii]|uniref:RidA family protein n=1 Tax=Vibrio furnissii TaxID=29494 RepID=UPI001EEAA112|nr:RidA family protein [Vibrio furnissii]MCG6267973.1 RidA family protein [Vibrio furnissii]